MLPVSGAEQLNTFKYRTVFQENYIYELKTNPPQEKMAFLSAMTFQQFNMIH
jgi:hypothetical protein